MKKVKALIILFVCLFFYGINIAQNYVISEDSLLKLKQNFRTCIDNIGYWKKMARLGVVPFNPKVTVEKPIIYQTTKIKSFRVIPDDSPDVPVTENPSTESENSIFVDPDNNEVVLNSNNSTNSSASTLYGANDFYSEDGGENWEGKIQGAAVNNSGDPATAISNNGRYYIGHINSARGQGIAYSTNGGVSWTEVQIAAAASGYSSLLDKNHLWVDNSTSSQYNGNLYCAWTNFGSATSNNQIEISRSINGGLNWSTPVNISTAVNAGNHNQGVNIQTGPNGEVYAIWAIYDSWPSDENAIGFAKSVDGGQTYVASKRIINNIKGIRNSKVPQNMRVNSFPVMAVDISNGPYRGNIYVVWANTGVPGINSGTGVSVYMIKSSNNGLTWSTPVKVNQDNNINKHHYLPWIACDPANGNISVIYYDNRNVSNTQAEAWVSNSFDGGSTWEDFRVSDVAFTPSPIAGLADGYFGDYLAITANNRKVYPCWTDNRTGVAMTYVSPFETGPAPNQPYIIYQSLQINDNTGNNNGLLDFGETVKISIAMQNIGDEPANNVNVKISTNSPYVTMIDSVENYGNFTNPDTIMIQNAFKFKVSDSIPNNKKIDFSVKTTDGDSIWISKFSILSHAPEYSFGKIIINDVSGNNNHQLDPGENAIIKIPVKNIGSCNSVNNLLQLYSTNPNLTINNHYLSIDTIKADVEKFAEFNISLSSAAQSGTFIDFIFSINSGLYQKQNIYFQPIGNITSTENFETGNFSQFNWIMQGNSRWVIANTGGYQNSKCAKSGTITNSQNSVLTITINVLLDDSISFFKKVSSENNYDFLKFYIDDVIQGQWSGTVNWSKEKYFIAAGIHTLKWEYMKDDVSSSGSDCAWIDNINFPSIIPNNIPLNVNSIAFNPEFCIGNSTQLYAVAIGGVGNYKYTWSPTSSLNNPNIQNPFATPETTTTYTVIAKAGLVTDTSTVVINVNQNPVVNIKDTSFCIGNFVNIDAGNGFQSYLWSTGDTTRSIIIDTISSVYVSVTDMNGCNSISDTINILSNPLPVVNLGKDTTINMIGQTLRLNAGNNFTKYLWQDGSVNSTYVVQWRLGTPNPSFYWVEVTNANGCKNKDSIIVNFFDNSSIDEISNNIQRIDVSPNPSANGIFTLTFNELKDKLMEIEIYDGYGKIIYNDKINVRLSYPYIKTINLSKKAKGIYYLKVKNDDKIKVIKLEVI